MIGIYGWRLELRHGPAVVAILFLLGGVGGMAAAGALESSPFAYGGNGLALALLVAWALPDLARARRGEEHDGDLLGTLVLAVLVVAMSAATREASIVAAADGRGGRAGRRRRPGPAHATVIVPGSPSTSRPTTQPSSIALGVAASRPPEVIASHSSQRRSSGTP